MNEDALWPRAASWLVPEDGNADIGVFGVPAHKTSISKTGAHKTPNAIRKALLRYSTYNWTRRIDIAALTANDFGDVRSDDFRAWWGGSLKRGSTLFAEQRLDLSVKKIDAQKKRPQISL